MDTPEGWAPPDPGFSPRPEGRPADPQDEPPSYPPQGQVPDGPPQDRPPYPQQPYPQGPYPPQPQDRGFGGPQAYPQQYGRPYGAPQYYPAPYGPPGYPGMPQRPPRIVPAAPGTPFHHLARTPLHRWWRPLVGSILVIGGAFIVVLGVTLVAAVIAAMVGGRMRTTGDSMFGNTTADIAVQLASLGALTPLVLLAVWLVQRRPIGSVISVLGRPRWRWFLTCAGLAVAMMVISWVMADALTALTTDQPFGWPGWAGWHGFLLPAVVILVLVPFQSTAEEFLFRGWLLQAIGSCTLETRTGAIGRRLSVVFRSPWPGILISAAVFTSGHGYTGWAMVDIFCFGAVGAWLAVRTGGLETSAALHITNNLFAFLLPAAAGQLAGSMKQGGEAWQDMVSSVIPLLMFATAVTLLAKRRDIARVSPPVPNLSGATGPVADAR